LATDLTKNTLAKGIKLLEVIAESGDYHGVTFSSIVDAVQLNRSNVYRYLMILMELGWLERDEETLRYRIGLHLLQTASTSYKQFDLRTRALPLLQELSHQTGLTVHLAIFHPPLIVYIDKIEPEPISYMQSRRGLTANCYSTALGKAMLATLSDQQIRSLLPAQLPAMTPNTIPNLDILLVNLAEARLRGFTYEMEENEIGIGCVGAPILGFDGYMVAAISLTGRIEIMKSDQFCEFGCKVAETAQQISTLMGYRNPNGQTQASHSGRKGNG